MGKKLVIVESPAKAKTIGKYLGKDYKITASYGHIRDLPDNTTGVSVNNNFKPIYIPTQNGSKVIKELKELAKDVDFVYIATDPDREGEAIAWHIAYVLKIDPASSCRVTFNEITEKVVKAAIDNPRPINLDLVNSQQARRILDRLVGYELSPLISEKVHISNLSAGRVQSAATKLVMDRDALIDAFIPTDYWLVKADVKTASNDEFSLSYYGSNSNGQLIKPKDGRITSEEEANRVVSVISGKDFTITNVKKDNKARKPYAPFTTSTLQQEASSRLRFSSSTTTNVAQKLYEGVEISGLGQTSLISYIRTDSVRVSEEAVAASRSLITSKYGKEYLSPKARVYKNKNSAQDAHEAIRPTHFDLPPESIKSSLRDDQYKLYKLIWERFLASQMSDAKVDTVTIEATCETEVFRVHGETTVFPGFLKVYADLSNDKIDAKNEKTKLPELAEGQILTNMNVISDNKQTLPPAHFNEASLIKTMEEYGIGRPSTYSSIVNLIQNRKYVEKVDRNLIITDLGKIVTTMIASNFEKIVDVSFTADVENQLDEVEAGKKDWVELLSEFYPDFHAQVVTAKETIEAVKIEDQKTGEKCPTCGEGDLVIKNGRNGKFIACSCFPKCTYTKNIEIVAKGKCPYCGSGLLVRKTKTRKNFYVCDKKGSDSNCEFLSWYLPIDDRKCDMCGSYMVWKNFRKKTYPSCSNAECESNKRKSSKENKNE